MKKKLFRALQVMIITIFMTISSWSSNPVFCENSNPSKQLSRKDIKKILLDLEVYETAFEIRNEFNKLLIAYKNLIWVNDIIKSNLDGPGADFRKLEGVIRRVIINPYDDLKQQLGSHDPKTIKTLLIKNAKNITNTLSRLDTKLAMLTKDFDFEFSGLEKKLDMNLDSNSLSRKKLESELERIERLKAHIDKMLGN